MKKLVFFCCVCGNFTQYQLCCYGFWSVQAVPVVCSCVFLWSLHAIPAVVVTVFFVCFGFLVTSRNTGCCGFIFGHFTHYYFPLHTTDTGNHKSKRTKFTQRADDNTAIATHTLSTTSERIAFPPPPQTNRKRGGQSVSV